MRRVVIEIRDEDDFMTVDGRKDNNALLPPDAALAVVARALAFLQ